jgi:hypothetical protein
LAIYEEDGECKGGQLAFYLELNYKKSKMTCQALVGNLKQQHLDPLITNLTPETDFESIETAFVTLISAYNAKCVGPASDEVLNTFIQVKIVEMIYRCSLEHTHHVFVEY